MKLTEGEKSMGTILYSDGTHEHVEPKDGEHFTFDEVYRMIDCLVIEIHRIGPRGERCLLVDEDGYQKGTPIVNRQASQMFGVGNIVGDVLQCKWNEIE